ncbi:MAG: TolB family protein, partial [Candidatus Saccharimonadales bacterium]
SPDGTMIATSSEQTGTVGVTDRAGMNGRVLVHLDTSGPNGAYLGPVSWTPDGKYLVYAGGVFDKPPLIGLVPITGGQTKVLFTGGIDAAVQP